MPVTVRMVVRDVVSVAAPEELPLVDGLARLDDAVVVRRFSRRRQRRDPLGFGVEEIAALATPVVWLAVNEAAKQAGETAANETVKGVKALTRKVFRRKSGPVEVPPLSTEQLREVRRVVLELSKARGIEAERADALADAVVVRLTIPALQSSADLPPTTVGDGEKAED